MKTLKTIATRRLWLKLLSLLFALIIWSYIINTTPSLTRSKYVSGLSVAVTRSSQLTEKGLALATDVYTEYMGNIAATVAVSQSQYSQVTGKSVDVAIDVSGINTAGEHEVVLNASSTYGTVTQVYPKTITVLVEHIESKDIHIETSLRGTRDDEYWYRIKTEELQPITISGPISIVRSVAKVAAQVEVTGQTSPLKRTVELHYYDSTGNIINPRLLAKSYTSAVEVEIYPKRELPVSKANLLFSVAEGYEITDIQLDKSTVTVAAAADILNNYDKITLRMPSDIPLASQTFTEELSVTGQENFKDVSPKTISVTVVVSEIRDTKQLLDVPINPRELGDGLKAALSPQTFNMSVTGSRSEIEGFESNDVHAYVDLEGLGVGVYELPVEIGNNPQLTYASITPSKVRVEITH